MIKHHCRGRMADGAPNPIDVHVGHRIKMRRLVQGMSQKELAEEIGTTFQQVQKYEKGTNRVSASRLYDVAKVLQTDPNYFFEEIDVSTDNTSPRALADAPQKERECPTTQQIRLIQRFNALPHNLKNAVYNLVKETETNINGTADDANE